MVCNLLWASWVYLKLGPICGGPESQKRQTIPDW